MFSAIRSEQENRLSYFLEALLEIRGRSTGSIIFDTYSHCLSALTYIIVEKSHNELSSLKQICKAHITNTYIHKLYTRNKSKQ